MQMTSKKRSWLCLIKRLFFPDSIPQQQQKRKKCLFERLAKNKELPLLTLSPSSPPLPSIQAIEVEAEEKQSKCEEKALKLLSQCEVQEGFPLNHQFENHVEVLAAIKIQTSYRGHLARKALRALKGFVRLQAIIRGRAVRRQAMTTLKCLQAIVNIQSEVCTRRSQMVQSKYRDLHLQDLQIDKPKKEQDRRQRMDDRLLSKDEEIDIILRKKEAILRKQRIKAYSFNHRNSTDSEDSSKTEGRLNYWLEQYVNDQALRNDKIVPKQLKLRNIDTLNYPRRSFHNHRKQSSCGEDSSHPSSPASTPTYMAATESAKAKTRSLSSPRVRPIMLQFEGNLNSDSDYSPYKQKISPMSSINSEVTSCLSSKISNRSSSCCSSSQQKSPSFKGLSVAPAVRSGQVRTT